MSQPLLELTKITRQFISGEQIITVLDNLDLTVAAGELVAIMGASGSGKSTLMNILGCLDQASAGSYRIAGQEVNQLDNNALAQLRRERFGFIFQHYHLMTHLTMLQNVEVPAIYAGIDKVYRCQRASQLLQRLSLGERLTHRPNQLSGGQQQRVSIARALMNGGEVILADEPTGALDSKSGGEIIEILLELHRMGHTIIMVTHDPQVAQHAQRIIEIKDGKIVADRQSVPLIDCSPTNSVPVQAVITPLLSKVKSISGFYERFAEAFRMATVAIMAHRVRTLLTMLGIIIGITAVVSVVAIGQGARQKIIDDINSMGTNVIDIYPGKDWGDEKAGTIYTLVPDDLVALSSQKYVDSVTPIVNRTILLRHRNIKANSLVNGVGENYFRVRGLTMAQGNIFSSQETQRLAQVAIIDHNAHHTLFPHNPEPIGEIILVGNLPCQVIGITQKRESPFGDTQNLRVWLPYTTVMGRLLRQNYFNGITVRIRDGQSNTAAEANLTKLIQLRHGNVKDFFTNSSDTILQTVKKTTATMTLLISSIAIISLLVGGIGVMNIMLVSVSERTHEIGIRMAVGARQGDIMQQFLIESVLVCLIGGVIGMLLAGGVGLIFPLFITAIKMKFSLLSFVAAFICSSLIGIVFGFFPARNAARLDPIVALARE